MRGTDVERSTYLGHFVRRTSYMYVFVVVAVVLASFSPMAWG
jgi:hypothetical protein